MPLTILTGIIGKFPGVRILISELWGYGKLMECSWEALITRDLSGEASDGPYPCT